MPQQLPDANAWLQQLQQQVPVGPRQMGTHLTSPPSTVPGSQTNLFTNPTVGRNYANMSNQVQGLLNLMPYLSQAFNQTLTPSALAQLGASQATSGGYNQLMTDLYRQFGPQLNEIGNQINLQNQMANAGNMSQVVNGPGQQLVDAALRMQQQIDPEFFSNRAAAGAASNNLLDLATQFAGKGLSPTEIDAITKGLARQNQQAGTEYTPSQTNTVSNAMQYGQAGTERALKGQNALASAISASAAFLPQSKSGLNGFNIATSQSGQTNPGNNLFMGVNQSTPGGSTFAGGLASDLSNQWNSQTSLERTIQSQKKDWLDQFSQFSGALNNSIGAIGGLAMCWVAREVYGATNPQWLIFRKWMINEAPKWLFNLYLQEGERFAKFIHNKPFIKRVVKFFMDKVTYEQ